MDSIKNLLGRVQSVRQGGMPDSHTLMNKALVSKYADESAVQFIMTPTTLREE